MLAAIVPLVSMPRVTAAEAPGAQSAWAKLGKPFGSRRFWALLAFGGWFSFANGITQTLQFSYPQKVLHVGILMMLAVQTMMRGGQFGVSPALGRAADRFGAKPMMLVCLLIAAQGPLFYYFATPEESWWFLGAWFTWIAYAGFNIGLPTLVLKIASAEKSESAEYLAVFFTLSGLCYGVVTLLGAWLFDRFGASCWYFLGRSWDYSQAAFLAGWIARCLAVMLLFLVAEPSASRTHSERLL